MRGLSLSDGHIPMTKNEKKKLESELANSPSDTDMGKPMLVAYEPVNSADWKPTATRKVRLVRRKQVL